MNDAQRIVTVVVPIYKLPLSPSERLSWEQCLRILGHYSIQIVHPQTLSVAGLLEAGVVSKPLSDHHFVSIASYNRLLTSVDFYDLFADYAYILIHQLDAFVFRDELLIWCQKGYDYVGSPGFPDDMYNILTEQQADQWAAALSSSRPLLNGGLSLRRIKAMKRYLRIHNLFFPTWVGNEDMLFSLFARRLILMRPFIRLPHWQEALRFSFEKSPQASLALIEGTLPFGCHAWERYDPVFWAGHIVQS